MTHSRALGRSGLQIQPIVFGGNVFGWSADETTSFALLDAFVDAGFNLIDTADAYSGWVPGNHGGESETIIGRWLARSGKRDKVLIATKVGKWSEHPGLSPENIVAAVEDSLTRLQTDVIDLYQAHADDESVPLEATLAAFGRLIEQGKVRAIGASNYSAARLRDALDISEQYKLPRYESLQPEYNLYDRVGYEAELEPLVREREVGVISYYSLASGFLTGKYRSADDASKSSARCVGGQAVRQSAWLAHPAGAGRSGRHPHRHARADRLGLVDRAAGPERTDRQCHQRDPATRRTGGSARVAERRSDCAAG